jgi:hypothetical protein
MYWTFDLQTVYSRERDFTITEFSHILAHEISPKTCGTRASGLIQSPNSEIAVFPDALHPSDDGYYFLQRSPASPAWDLVQS